MSGTFIFDVRSDRDIARHLVRAPNGGGKITFSGYTRIGVDVVDDDARLAFSVMPGNDPAKR